MDCMRMLNTKRLLSLFVGLLMIGIVSLTTFNLSSNTCVSYADEGLDDIDLSKAADAAKNGMIAGAVSGAALEAAGGMAAGPVGAAVGAINGAIDGAVVGAIYEATVSILEDIKK